MGKSLLYAANTNSQVLAVNGVVNFGNIVRRYGCNCNLSGGNAIVKGSGYYNISTNFTFTAGSTGVGTITLYKDGVAIPGASASGSFAANTVYCVAIPTAVKDFCDCESTITAVITGIGMTFSNASIVVEKM